MNDWKQAYENKNVLITGGLGFIGSTLTRCLVEVGAQVTLLDSLVPQYGGNLFNIHGIEDRVNVNIADVRDANSMNHLVIGQDYLFNLAGTLSHTDSMTDPVTDLEINCRSQLSILEACRHNNRDLKIVFAGTRGQYGKAQTSPVNEQHPLQPTDVNGINKLAGELYHILYNNVYGIRAASLRLTNTYGPRHQMKHHKQGIINWFMRLVLEDREITLFGDGKQVRDLNYVDDVAEAFLLAGASDACNGEVYNLGGEPIALVEAVQKMIRITGTGSYTFKPFPEAARAIEIGDYVGDYTKLKNTVGWQPRIALDEGFGRTLEYYKENRGQYWS